MRNSLSVTIENVRRETIDVVTLYFKRPFDFVAGQYVSVYFKDVNPPEGKAYSLSSRPTDELASITIKNVGGPFSTRLCNLQAGDKLSISNAYGNFNPLTNAPLVGIAIGAGLSPIWSILATNDTALNTLHYGNKTDDNIVYRDELAKLQTCVHHYISRQSDTQYNTGRMKVESVIKSSPPNAHFLVCGSVSFVRGVFCQLEQADIGRKKISTEIFFE